ncbi:MAG: hypothetical protein APR54_08895 [Candidatus Cloacimonas sp. SDB]|nr:MAG: hypothetical protein APR54_08895 [Candidatus Cloacimonas sp. SDB]
MIRYSDQTLFLEVDLLKENIPGLILELEKFAASTINSVDLQQVSNIDSAGVVFLDEIFLNFNQPELINASEKILNAISKFSSLNLPLQKRSPQENIFIQVGDFFVEWKKSFIWGLYLTADILYWSVVGFFKPRGMKKEAVITQSLLIGVDAVGIIGLLSLILGLIIALQSAAQLRQFGANIYIADLIAISMVREMGPMMTAIIVAGRSGSSIASEIATMKVTEELDALRMMALDPIRYIVVPKFHAITLCMPLLVMLSIFVGIGGGLIIALTYLDLSAISYINQVFSILTFKDIFIGLMKSVVFAWVIVIISSYYGFRVKGGAEGVGKVTTLSVVASIFWVIVLDAINSILFYF